MPSWLPPHHCPGPPTHAHADTKSGQNGHRPQSRRSSGLRPPWAVVRGRPPHNMARRHSLPWPNTPASRCRRPASAALSVRATSRFQQKWQPPLSHNLDYWQNRHPQSPLSCRKPRIPAKSAMPLVHCGRLITLLHAKTGKIGNRRAPVCGSRRPRGTLFETRLGRCNAPPPEARARQDMEGER